jgi:5-methylcytosine-specific restriction protein A
MLTPAGGSRAWRRTAAAVLWRDQYVCRMLRDGRVCGRPASTANHITPRALGGSDEMSNLEAACVPCNMGAGARIRAQSAAVTVAHHNTLIKLVALLDAHGAPIALDRAAALVLIRQHSPHPYRGALIDAACHHRRARGALTRV